MTSTSTGRWHRGDLARWLFAGAVVAVLDISFAATYWVVIRGKSTFPRILQSIAAGVLGRAAFQGGARAAVLGAALHCVIALGWAGLFLIAARRWPPLTRMLYGPNGALKTGLPYGVLVWLLMNLVIVRLSRATPAPVLSLWFGISLVWHAVGVGLPIAGIIREPGRPGP